jgi:hypothetical protein
MPWRECSVMDERMQFLARRLAGELMAELCGEFGISRKTGYKIFYRYCCPPRQYGFFATSKS